MQMMLPGPVLEHDADYIRAYRDHCRSDDQYVILDNGAAERNQISHDALFDMAINWRPNELVLPDVMGYGAGTLRATETFFQHQEAESLIAAGTRLAYVVQGTDCDDAFEHLMVFAEIWWAQHVSVLHFPRLLVKTNAFDDRLRLVIKAYAELRGRFEYHLLGANTIWPSEIKTASHLEFIRSMDTSTPYYMAHWQRPLDDRVWDGPLERPSNYFSRHRSSFQGSDLYVNTFLAWSHGKEPGAQTPPGKL